MIADKSTADVLALLVAAGIVVGAGAIQGLHAATGGGYYTVAEINVKDRATYDKDLSAVLSGMLLEPTLVLLVGIEIIQHDVKLAGGKGGNDLVHEAKEFDAPAPLFVLAQNPVATSRAANKVVVPCLL